AEAGLHHGFKGMQIAASAVTAEALWWRCCAASEDSAASGGRACGPGTPYHVGAGPLPYSRTEPKGYSFSIT
ncbi:hypothetical protein ACWCQF_06760, partial [Streptomyces rubiginosohelvolus]